MLHEATPPRGTVRRSAGLRRKRNERKHQFAARALKGARTGGKAGSSEGASAESGGGTATATAEGESDGQ